MQYAYFTVPAMYSIFFCYSNQCGIQDGF